jgi:hypothetical protein
MRCGICDRPHVDCHRTGDAVCEKNRVQWRARACELETELEQLKSDRRTNDALLHTLGTFITMKKAAAEALSAYSKAAMPMINLSLKPKEDQKVIHDAYWAARRASEAAEAEVMHAMDALVAAYDTANAKNEQIPETPPLRPVTRSRGHGYWGNE